MHIPSGKPTPDGTFCHDCLTNQTMIISLLANYLPDETVSERYFPLTIPH
jgi:hypothetical protein